MISCKAALLTLVAVLLSVASAQRGLPRCGDFCSFYFCKANGFRTVFEQVGPRLLLRDANAASNPFVCRKIISDPRTSLNQTIKVIKTGEAEVHPVEDRGKSTRPFVKISQYRPAGLSPPFPKSYFALRNINRFPPIPGEKGISRSASSGNQNKFADELCVKIPIKNYNLLKDNGKVDRKVKRSKPMEDCVSFRTVVPKILVELTWDSSDDLDVIVKEPNGNEISFRNPKSSTGGGLNLHQNVDRCGEDPDGREQIRWLRDSTPLSGSYSVTIRHFELCKSVRTKWSLAVIIDGKVALFKDGKSKKGKNRKVFQGKFNFL